MTLAAQSYITIARGLLARELDGEDPALVDLYVLLMLAKGEATALADVHDAWSLWRHRTHPHHRSLVPFDELAEKTKELDRPYMQAIHRAARAWTEWIKGAAR